MGFGRIFFFIFAFALLEVLVLAKVAGLIGWPITIIATVVTALLGSYLFRRQGLETWVRLNQRMQQGDMPGQEMVEGIMLLLGGALLITPGFITDAVGFALLLPGSRPAGLYHHAGRRLHLQQLYPTGSQPVSAAPRPGRWQCNHRGGSPPHRRTLITASASGKSPGAN